MTGTARKGAGDLTAQLAGHLLTGEVRADLDRMLLVDAALGMTRLEWLNSPARDASASSVKTAIDKLAWFRGIDDPRMDVSRLPNERRRFPAELARRRARAKIPRLEEALDGTGFFTAGHAVLLDAMLRRIDSQNAGIDRISAVTGKLLAPWEEQLQQAESMPGWPRRAAQDVLAETGPDMIRFATPGHLVS